MGRIASSLLLVILASVSVAAEVIHLRNGNTINGTLVGINGNTFQIKTDYGEMQVPRSAIESITFDSKSEGAADVHAIDETLDGTNYTNHTAKFQVAVPPGWKIRPDAHLKEGSSEIVAALTSPDSRAFFFVTTEDFSGSVASYRAIAEMRLKGQYPDLHKNIS